MGILVKDLKRNQEVIFRKSPEYLIQSTIRMIDKQDSKIIVVFSSGDSLALNPDDILHRVVEDLVPKEKKHRLAPPGKTPYEVLIYDTEFEYETTDSEQDIKTKIRAKFRDYEEAFDYAKRQSFKTIYARVVLRA